MVPAVSPAFPPFSILCAVSFGVIADVGHFFFFFFDFVYCSPDAAQFPLSCFSLNACDDLFHFPLCTSYDTINLYEAVLCVLRTCEKGVFLYALHIPYLYFQRSDLIVWLPLSI
jgi:hypothetical protein